jgi:small subunit ribosomal protein S15
MYLTKKEKGQSHSIRPVSKRPPQWCKYEPEEVEALVVKLARDGNSSSRIGTILRDQHGIPLTKTVTGKSVTDILKEANMAPSIPEDLNMLLRKASGLHTHLERNRADLHNKRSLQLTEANIYKLSKYYKRKGVLPANWRYSRQTAIVT